MRLEGFLKALKATPREWRLDSSWRGDEAITDPQDRCPLEAVAGVKISFVQRQLGLRGDTVNRVVHTADGADNFPDYDPKLRARLLKACDLTPHTREGVK